MKKIAMLFSIIIVSFSLSLHALTNQQIQSQAQQALQLLVSSHTKVFGVDNIYKEALDTRNWDEAFMNLKKLIATIIVENKNLIGTADAVLVDAFKKVQTAEADLVNAIKISRATLKTPQNSQQIKILLQIKNDMIALQTKLASNKQVNFARNEAQKLLNNAAMFIETTASKAIKDSVKR